MSSFQVGDPLEMVYGTVLACDLNRVHQGRIFLIHSDSVEPISYILLPIPHYLQPADQLSRVFGRDAATLDTSYQRAEIRGNRARRSECETIMPGGAPWRTIVKGTQGKTTRLWTRLCDSVYKTVSPQARLQRSTSSVF